MTIMRLSFFLILFMFSGAVWGADAMWCSTHIYRKEDLSIAKQVRISNALNHYRLDFLLSKANTLLHGKAPSFKIVMREPSQKYGFSAPLWNFMVLSVNNINMSQLDFHEDDLTVWKKDSAAGVDLALNFDGAKMTLRFFMRDGSPVLWGSLDNKIPKAVSETLIEFRAVPSFLPGTKLEGVYERTAMTAARTLEMSKRKVSLSPEDKYLLLFDKKYKYPDTPDAAGPCFLTFLYNEVAFSQLFMSDFYMSRIFISLRNDFQSFKFGLWETEQHLANQESIEYLVKNPEEFKFKENASYEK